MMMKKTKEFMIRIKLWALSLIFFGYCITAHSMGTMASKEFLARDIKNLCENKVSNYSYARSNSKPQFNELGKQAAENRAEQIRKLEMALQDLSYYQVSIKKLSWQIHCEEAANLELPRLQLYRQKLRYKIARLIVLGHQ